MNIRKLNEIREVRNLSCVSIAEQSGVPYRTVSKLFSGENQNPTWETITAMTRVLNWSLDELLNTHQARSSARKIKRIRKFRSLSAHGKRMVDIVLDEEYHRFLEQMYREEKSMRLIWWMTSASSAMSRSPRRPAMCAH
ncbi:MAG: helix-turn-helix domain-containing protein [Ruthenibacterium lactatiformans]